MRSARRIAFRSPLVMAFLVAWAVATGWLGAARGDPTNWRHVIQWLGDSIDLTLPATAALVTLWVFGPDDTPGLRRDRITLGLSQGRWTLDRLAIVGCLMLGWCLVAVASALSFSRLGGPLNGSTKWFAHLLLMLVRAGLVILWTGALVVSTRLVRSMVIAGCAAALGLVVGFLQPTPFASLARILVPTAALRALRPARISFPGGPTVWALALASLAVWTAVAVYLLASQKDVPDRQVRRAVTRQTSILLGIVGAGLTSLVVGATVPTLVTATLPLDWRPYLLIQRLGGEAPEQRAADFILALRTQPEAAGGYTADNSVDGALGEFVWAFAALPSGTRFVLAGIDGDGVARVDATGTPLSLCMQQGDGGWLVQGVATGQGCVQ